MKPISLDEICCALGGRFQNIAKNKKIYAITTDTREIEKDCLFVPIKGENFDGHDFILKAFEEGAICALSEKHIDTEKPVILVDDTRKAFRDLAMYYLTLFNVKVVAVTGSVGKTTTKDIIASVLSQKYNVLKTQGNFNNEIGLPKTIFNLTDKHEVAVFEMGMNNFGEIKNLSEIAKPNIGVITNIGVSHIENLGSREGILKAKLEIFDYMKKDGIAVLNADDDMLQTFKNKDNIKTLWFGIENKKDYYAQNLVPKGIEGIDARLCFQDKYIDVSIKVPGKHMVLNSLCAAAVGNSLGLSTEEIKKGIETFVPTQMRMSVTKTKGGITLINDAYNANPVSVKAAIDVLCFGEGRKIAVLGDMFELGEFSDSLHFQVGEYAAEKSVDVLICIGKNAHNIYKGAVSKDLNAIYFSTQEEFLENHLDRFFKDGDVCLVKASRGMHFEKIAEKIQEVK